MNISFDCPDKINGLMTITLEETDYKDELDKTLKDMRRRAQMPGFRQGHVPMGMIQRMYGPSAKADIVNKVLGKALFDYIQENKINMLGQPLANEDNEPADLEKPAPYTFKFDIAVAPEINVNVDKDTTLPYYDIQVDDKLVDNQVEMLAQQNGRSQNVDAYEEDGDMLKGDLRELDADGNTLEGGITVSEAMLLPSRIKVDDEKALFTAAKPGDIITFNPRKAYPDNDSEVAGLLKIDRDKVGEHTGDFSFQVTEISRYVKHAVDQELFDICFGKDQVKSEKEFRQKISDGLKAQLEGDSNFRLLQDLRAYCEKEAGELQYPEALLKRILKANAKNKSDEDIDKEYPDSIKYLTWDLMRNQLAEKLGVKVEQADIHQAAKEMARMQFAQYGMNNVPDEYIDNYAKQLAEKEENQRQFSDRALDVKLLQAVKKTVKLDEKSISLDEFNKLS